MEQKSDVVSQDRATYCRNIEAYLCQKNEGHLVRIVGPAFEQVCSWAERGVPLKIAFRGIDRYCERYHAKSGRRRPVRIEFCEADILDAFDDWRRAVGVGAIAQNGDIDAAQTPSRKAALATHIDRAVARLRALSIPDARSARFTGRMSRAVGELETLAAEARRARGESRERIVEKLAAMDAELLAATVDEMQPTHAEELKREAETELAPFGARMPSDEREKAVGAAYQRLVREAIGVPTLTYE